MRKDKTYNYATCQKSPNETRSRLNDRNIQLNYTAIIVTICKKIQVFERARSIIHQDGVPSINIIILSKFN